MADPEVSVNVNELRKKDWGPLREAQTDPLSETLRRVGLIIYNHTIWTLD